MGQPSSSPKQDEACCCHKDKAIIPLVSCQPGNGEDSLPELVEPASQSFAVLTHRCNIPDNGVCLLRSEFGSRIFEGRDHASTCGQGLRI